MCEHCLRAKYVNSKTVFAIVNPVWTELQNVFEEVIITQIISFILDSSEELIEIKYKFEHLIILNPSMQNERDDLSIFFMGFPYFEFNKEETPFELSKDARLRLEHLFNRNENQEVLTERWKSFMEYYICLAFAKQRTSFLYLIFVCNIFLLSPLGLLKRIVRDMVNLVESKYLQENDQPYAPKYFGHIIASLVRSEILSLEEVEADYVPSFIRRDEGSNMKNLELFRGGMNELMSFTRKNRVLFGID